MIVTYMETIPDVDVYHDLRTSVGWSVSNLWQLLEKKDFT